MEVILITEDLQHDTALFLAQILLHGEVRSKLWSQDLVLKLSLHYKKRGPYRRFKTLRFGVFYRRNSSTAFYTIADDLMWKSYFSAFSDTP